MFGVGKVSLGTNYVVAISLQLFPSQNWTLRVNGHISCIYMVKLFDTPNNVRPALELVSFGLLS